jgi:hypothetical protein
MVLMAVSVEARGIVGCWVGTVGVWNGEPGAIVK